MEKKREHVGTVYDAELGMHISLKNSYRFKLVRWLRGAMNEGDNRSYDPVPIWNFCERYHMEQEEPGTIYAAFGAYQKMVIEKAAQHFDEKTMNRTSFYDLVKWFESNSERSLPNLGIPSRFSFSPLPIVRSDMLNPKGGSR